MSKLLYIFLFLNLNLFGNSQEANKFFNEGAEIFYEAFSQECYLEEDEILFSLNNAKILLEKAVNLNHEQASYDLLLLNCVVESYINRSSYSIWSDYSLEEKLEKALEKWPENSYYWYFLAMIYFLKFNTIDYMEKSASLGNKKALLFLGWYYINYDSDDINLKTKGCKYLLKAILKFKSSFYVLRASFRHLLNLYLGFDDVSQFKHSLELQQVMVVTMYYIKNLLSLDYVNLDIINEVKENIKTLNQELKKYDLRGAIV